MKKMLPQVAAFLSLLFAGIIGKPTNAFAQAYDMIYRDTLIAASPGVFSHSFSFYLYQNCNPAAVNFSNLPVIYNPGNGMVATEFIAGPLPVIGMGNPFCSTQSPVCSVTGPLNYQKTGTTFTFSTKGNYSSPGIYTMSTEFTPYGVGFGSFQAANILGNFGIDPRILNMVSTGFNVTSGIINRPPQFVNPPVIFANVNQPVSYSIAAKDPDGDSLVYRLRPVIPNATYAPGFTYLNPITANPALSLNTRTGAITFTPTAYDAAAGPGATANKYVIGLDIEEYRKSNGGAFKIGTIQRNVLVNVISLTNNSPVLSASHNGTTIAPNTIIDAYPGTQVRLNFGASDPDISNYVSPVSNVVSVLPGATFGVTLNQNPNSGILYWTPTIADVRPEPYFFNVTATDDACPYPASITHTYGIRVRSITGISSDKNQSFSFQVYPNPAIHAVNFKLAAEKAHDAILIYNMLGKQIDRIELPKSKSDSQELQWQNAGKFASGTYLAKLVSEGKIIQTLKFTKLQ